MGKTVSPKLSSVPVPVLTSCIMKVKEGIRFYALARIAELQRVAKSNDDTLYFSSESVHNKKPWDCYANWISDKPPPKGGVTQPVTVNSDAALLVLAPLIALVEIVEKHHSDLDKMEKIVSSEEFAEKISELEGAEKFRVLAGIISAMGKNIRTPRMSSDIGQLNTFRVKLEACVSNKKFLDVHGESFAEFYLDFVRCIGWYAGNSAWENFKPTKESRRLTFNLIVARTLLRNIMGHIPNLASSSEAMLKFCREQAEESKLLLTRAKEDGKKRKLNPKTAKKRVGSKNAKRASLKNVKRASSKNVKRASSKNSKAKVKTGTKTKTKTKTKIKKSSKA